MWECFPCKNWGKGVENGEKRKKEQDLRMTYMRQTSSHPFTIHLTPGEGSGENQEDGMERKQQKDFGPQGTVHLRALKEATHWKKTI